MSSSHLQELIHQFENSQKVNYIKNELAQKFSPDILQFVQKNKLITFDLDPLNKSLPLNQLYYRILSSSARQHAFELINQLYESKKYSFLELKMDYDFSFIILSNGKRVVKLIQINNPNEFQALQENIPQAQEVLLQISAYTAFSDPRQSLDLWESYLVAITPKIQRQFQEVPRKPILKEEFLNQIEKILLKNDSVLLIGAGAYEFLVHAVDPKRLPSKGIGGTPEFVSWDIQTHLRQLSEVFPEMETKRDLTPLGGRFFPGYKYSVSLGKQKLVDLYDGSQVCLPFVVYDQINLGSLHTLLRFLYLGQLLSFRLPKSKELFTRLNTMANNLLWLKEKYPNHPLLKTWIYSTSETKGTNQLNTERNFRIRKWNGRIADPLAIKSYKPEIEIQNVGQFRTE